MDGRVRYDLWLLWRALAVVLIYPASIAAGLGSVMRIVAGCCVTLESWTTDGALGNFALGFPALAGLAALWVSALHRPGWLARDRARFVLVLTGLMTGLALEILFLRAGLAQGAPRWRSPGFLGIWTIAGPLLVGVVNLCLLIRAREAAFAAGSPRTGPTERAPYAGPHVRRGQVLRPVNLRPYRPATAAWPPTSS